MSVTSGAEVSVPMVPYFIFPFFDDFFEFFQLFARKPMIDRQFKFGLDPEFRLSRGRPDMDMLPRFFA
ncbi:MAG: hypothetical protein R3F07_10430 [Opitutaceae bacterium]